MANINITIEDGQACSVEFYTFLAHEKKLEAQIKADCFLRPGETGQHCLLHTIVSILNQELPFCS